MSASSELFASLYAKYAADTGAGGLNEANSVYRVMFFQSENDYNEQQNSVQPRIVCRFTEGNIDAFLRGAMPIRFQMQLYFNRNTEAVQLNAAVIINRLRAVYHRQTLASGSIWEFAPATIRGNATTAIDVYGGVVTLDWQTTATELSGV